MEKDLIDILNKYTETWQVTWSEPGELVIKTEEEHPGMFEEFKKWRDQNLMVSRTVGVTYRWERLHVRKI